MLYWVSEGALAVVVGGGEVAARKVAALKAGGCRVRVVAPAIADAVEADERLERTFRPEDLEGARLAFSATDDSEVNRAVLLACRSRGIPVNVADEPGACDFYMPAVIQRGDLTLAVSTGGACPGYAAFVRRDLDQQYGEEWGEALEIVAAARRWARPRGARWQSLMSPALLSACRDGDEGRVDALIRGTLGPDASRSSLGLAGA